jgi:hypothetical protein
MPSSASPRVRPIGFEAADPASRTTLTSSIGLANSGGGVVERINKP